MGRKIACHAINTHPNMSREEYTDYDKLYESMNNCRKSVSWKPSVKAFCLDATKNLHKMKEQLDSGTYRHGTPKPILITYPKRREGLSIPFRDRVYQRSINDNILYPKATRSFIYDNWACQRGKGTDDARERMTYYLRDFYQKYGLDGQVIQTDFTEYYKRLPHKSVNQRFSKCLDSDELKDVTTILEWQYAGDVGYNPGSQMVQIAGISVPDDFDHYVKEELHIKRYARYMDDTRSIVHGNAEYLLEKMKEKASEYGLVFHPRKTIITPLKESFMWLGYRYRLAETGKVLMEVNPKTVKAWRKKLFRMVVKEKTGEIEKIKTDEVLNSYLNHASKGTSKRLMINLEKYVKDLRRDL